MNIPYLPSLQKPKRPNFLFWFLILTTILILIGIARAETIKPKEGLNRSILHTKPSSLTRGHINLLVTSPIYTKGGLPLVASWYSLESLKKEGTWKKTKGVMANGEKFSDSAYTCATRLFPLGVQFKITNIQNQKSVFVVVTDRISKKFAKTRIDLTPKAFLAISNSKGLKIGLLSVKVEKL